MNGFRRFFSKGAAFLIAVSFVFLPVRDAFAVITTIVNDLDPKNPGAILVVSNIKGKGVPPNLKVVLNPGESRKLTAKNVVQFTVTQVFGDYRQKYMVSCPKDPRVKNKITLRLVDIKNNSMPAGCMLERTGTWTRLDGVQWDSHTTRATIRDLPQY